MPIHEFFSQTPASGTPGGGPPASTNIFLDALKTVASWDVLRRTGLPNEIDGGAIQPVSDIQRQNADRTPPAPPGGFTGFSITPDKIAFGAAALVGLVGLVLLVRK